jgi:hypothetical protein
MTETEWLHASEPHAMLEFVQRTGSESARKLRLFAVACSRRVWSRIDALGQAAVEIAERFADGLVAPDELRAARLACQGAGGQASWYAAATKPEIAAHNAARSAQSGVVGHSRVATEADELLVQAALLRDICVPLPFRPIAHDTALRAPTVVPLAQAIYRDRAFDRMAELAHALHEAGCANLEIVSHCRGPGPHVRGCWVVDLVLGKE